MRGARDDVDASILTLAYLPTSRVLSVELIGRFQLRSRPLFQLDSRSLRSCLVVASINSRRTLLVGFMPFRGDCAVASQRSCSGSVYGRVLVGDRSLLVGFGSVRSGFVLSSCCRFEWLCSRFELASSRSLLACFRSLRCGCVVSLQ